MSNSNVVAQAKPFDPRVLRGVVLDMARAGSTAHIACAFSIIELLAVLYRKFLNYPDNNPRSEGRDYLVLSKGHGVMAQYACMYAKGWLSQKDIDDYFRDGSRLKGLSDSHIPGSEVTSGSLGHGLSVGVGMALGAKISGSGQRTFIVVGDGELNEGAIWEGLLFAAHHSLNKLMLLVDENGLQAMGGTSEILSLGSISNKLTSFGFEVLDVDGHDEDAIELAIDRLFRSDSLMPKAIVARTTKGKGVSFMENNNSWHYRRLDAQTYELAKAEIASFLP